MRLDAHYGSILGYTLVARPVSAGQTALARAIQGCSVTGWVVEPDHLVLQGAGDRRSISVHVAGVDFT